MVIKVFSPPVKADGAWKTFSERQLFTTNRIVSFEYTKRWTKTGSFTLTIPFDRAKLQGLSLMGVICAETDGRSHWLLIENIEYDSRTIVLYGKDAKGLLATRIALYGTAQGEGTDGYDVVSGTTAQCIKHYLDNNCISPADAFRALPITWGGGVNGLQNDSYMARFEYLSDIVSELCDNAGIGCDIAGNLSGGGFTFTTKSGTDRSMNQSENNRVIFSLSWGNVRNQTFQHSVSDLYSVIYAAGSDNVTTAVFRDNNTPSGISRRECNVSVSVESTDDYFSKYALNQVTDNTEKHGCTVDAAKSGGYGTDYSLGDKVSVRDDFSGNTFHYVITEVTESYSAGQQGLTIVLGNQKQKPLQKIVNGFLSGTAGRR